jgi:superfamily II DNA or RNA helicase
MRDEGDRNEEDWEIAPLVDNERVYMRDQLRHILGEARSAKIAVGYFFVTGFEGLLDELSGLDEIQIVMGQRTSRATGEELGRGKEGRELVRGGYAVDDVVREIREELDGIRSEDALSRLDAVVRLMAEGKLSVRVYTKERGYFHPKGYWFDCRRTLHSDVGIVGSHNMSASALEENDELSFVTQDKWHTEALREWFNGKWGAAEPFDERLLELIRSSGSYQDYRRRKEERERSERELAHPYKYLHPVDFLRTVISRLRKGYLLDTEDLLVHFQKIDYHLCRDALQKFGGVILANTVGLGKSFIAARLARDYKRRGEDALFVVPTNTMVQWKEYLRIFGLEGERGLNMISHHDVSRSKFDPEAYADFEVIVVDESHKFRNPGSNRWGNFVERIKHPGADYILLTATPINNKMRDLYAQVRMFENERFRNEGLLGLYRDLEEYVRGEEDDDSLLPSIQELRRKVIVRTTRRDLKKLYDEVVIPGRGRVEVVDPEVVQQFYTLSGEGYEGIFDAFIDDFILPLKLPQVGIRNPSAAKSLHGLYKILLYKRMESSVFALHRSVEALKAKLERLEELVGSVSLKVLRGIEKTDYRRLLGGDSEDDLRLPDEDELEKEDGLEEGKRSEEYLSEIRHDLRIVDTFLSKLEAVRLEQFDYLDDKLEELKALLRRRSDEKTLIFTQFTATAEYLRKNLSGEVFSGRIIRKVTGGSRSKMAEAMRFSPSSYGEEAKTEMELEQGISIEPPYTDILISTETLAEGVNLQEADLVVNYDLPWNPVKLIQRVGRANRLGASEGLTAVNFLPDENIDQEMRLVARLKDKIHNIIQIINNEHSILSPEEAAMIERREANDLDLVERKRDMIRELDLDALEEGSEGEKVSSLDRWLLESAEAAGLRRQDLDGGEVSHNIPYTVMEGTPSEIYLYELSTEGGSYPGHYLSDEKGGEVPAPESLRSPRHHLKAEEVEMVTRFAEGTLREEEMDRRKAQREVFDVRARKVKTDLISELKNARRATSKRLTPRESELNKSAREAIAALESLRVPSRRKSEMRNFASKWFGNSEYLRRPGEFLGELEQLISELAEVSEVVAPSDSVSSELVAFCLYDRNAEN